MIMIARAAIFTEKNPIEVLVDVNSPINQALKDPYTICFAANARDTLDIIGEAGRAP